MNGLFLHLCDFRSDKGELLKAARIKSSVELLPSSLILVAAISHFEWYGPEFPIDQTINIVALLSSTSSQCHSSLTTLVSTYVVTVVSSWLE